MSLDELIKVMSSQFLYCEEAASILHLGNTTMNNVILHGPGGYGKTAMSKLFAKQYYKAEETETVMMGEGTISSYLLGGLDMKAMQDDGDILYKPARSWMSKRYVIFEEMLDALGPALENLKYILSEGEFPQRGSVYKSEVHAIAGCTNRHPEVWCKDSASLSALLSRFPYEQKIIWPRHEYADYANLLSLRLKQPCPEVAEACEICAEHKIILSPRDAIKMAEAFKARNTLGVFAFQRKVQGNKACLTAILAVQGKAEYRAQVRKIFMMITDRLGKLQPATPTNSNDMLEKVRYLDNSLKAVRVDEKLSEEYSRLKDQIKAALESYSRHAKPTVPDDWLMSSNVTPVQAAI